MRIVEISKSNYPEIIDKIYKQWDEGDAKNIALAAFEAVPSNVEDPTVLIALKTQDCKVMGIASYRNEGNQVKRINMATFPENQGTGKKLIKRIAFDTNFKNQWTKSKPTAWGWCERLGMQPGDLLEDGRKIYTWDSESIREFYEK